MSLAPLPASRRSWLARIFASKVPLHTGRCALLLLWSSQASAQTPSSVAVPYQAGSIEARERGEPWTLSASLYGYFPPDTGSYVQPTLTADREWLHLEVRYNYEALDTGSAWLGYNLSGGDTVAWDLSPMFGGIFGKFTGIAPGYRGSLQWRGVELDSEGEYVIDAAGSSAGYFYNWSELRFSVPGHLRVGVAMQHTRVYRSDREIQRGLLAGFSCERADLTGYVFDPGDSTQLVVIALILRW